MRNKVVKFDLSLNGIDKAITELENYKHWIVDKSNQLIQRLAREGYEIAYSGFSHVAYDGTNDVSLHVEQRNENAVAVVAIGASVLFIEFGTGITYPDNHPEAAENGMNRGEYGKGHGSQPYWYYYGDPGTNGVVKYNKRGEPVVRTRGNPANMTMYNTVRELEQDMRKIVSEVFV